MTLNVSQEYVSTSRDTILSQMHEETPSATEDVIIQGVSQDAGAGEEAVITYVHGKGDTTSAKEVNDDKLRQYTETMSQQVAVAYLVRYCKFCHSVGRS